MTSVLVIGYGNEVRGDDGAGPVIAREIDALQLPGVRTLVMQQLTPELAADLAEASLAIFVDAQVADAGDGVKVVPLMPDESTIPSGHVADPRGLLALAAQLYGQVSASWLVTVEAEDLGLQNGLSPSTRARVAGAVSLIVDLASGNATRNCSDRP